jgi:hypothetical protein
MVDHAQAVEVISQVSLTSWVAFSGPPVLPLQNSSPVSEFWELCEGNMLPIRPGG